MKHLYRFLILLSIVTLFNNDLRASHLYGGDVTYKCFGNNKYVFYVNYFYGCDTKGLLSVFDYTTPIIDIWDNCDTSFYKGFMAHMDYSSIKDVTQLCPTQKTTCNGGFVRGISKVTFYTDTITLSSTCTSFSYQSYMFFRIEGSINAIGAENTEITLNGTFNTLTNNNSPTYYTPYPIPGFCVNIPFTYNFGTEGLNGNKFKYKLIDGSGLTYASGYSGAQPLSGTTILDSITGTMTCTPTKIGFYFVDVEISEYTPSGTFLGSSVREITVFITSGTNNNPLGGAITNLKGGTAQKKDSYTLILNHGDSFSFDAVFTDANASDILSLETNLTTALPGATITTSGTNPITATISWNSSQANASSDYSFSIVAKDNVCSPSPGIGSVSYYISFNTATSAGADISICGTDSAHLSASGGNTFTWSALSGDMAAVLSCNPCANPTVKPSKTTTYKVVSDLSAGNTDTVKVGVVPNFFTVTASADKAICKGDSTTLDVTNGLSYFWNPATGLSNPNIKNPIAKPTVTTTYTVTVSSGSCASGTDSVKVTVNDLPTATITANGPITFCQGDSVQLTASSGTSYLWSNGASTQTITIKSFGNYTVKVTNNSGCSATASATAVAINSLPSAIITASGSTTFCNGDSVLLTASNGTSYLWSNGANTSSIRVKTAGNYTVKVIDVNGCSATSSVTTVTVNLLTNNVALNKPATASDNFLLYSTPANPFKDPPAIWDAGKYAPAWIQVDLQGQFNIDSIRLVVSQLPAGNTLHEIYTSPDMITWTKADVISGYTSTGNILIRKYTPALLKVRGVKINTVTSPSWVAWNEINVFSAVTVPVITASNSAKLCQGDSVILDAGAGFSFYKWSTGDTTQKITVKKSGNYIVTVRNSCGSIVSSSPITVTFNPLPNAIIIAGNSTTLCNGDSVLLTASNGTSYLWSNGASTSSIRVKTTGNYTVKVIDANTCSATSSPAIVTVNPLPAASITGTTIICTGSNTTLTASGGTSYSWNNGQITAAITVNPAADSVYTVTVKDDNNCSSNKSATVKVNATPSATITGTTTICNGSNTTLTASGATSYLWNTNATTAAITVNPATTTTYTATVKDVNNCSSSKSIIVTVNPLPTASITGTTTICSGSNTTLTASDGTSYSWNNGQITATITVSPAADSTYTVTVKDVNNCSINKSVIVTVNPLPSKPTITQKKDSLIASLANGYQWNLNNQPITGAIAQVLVTDKTGAYSVIVTDANGCSTTSDTLHFVITAIEEQTKNISVSLYPNPNNGIFTLFADIKQNEKVLIKIVNVLGEEVYAIQPEKTTGKYEKEINLSAYPAGIYFLQMSTDGQTISRKLILEK